LFGGIGTGSQAAQSMKLGGALLHCLKRKLRTGSLIAEIVSALGVLTAKGRPLYYIT